MKRLHLTSALLLFALGGCDSPDRQAPIVEIQDPKIETDICAAVYLYAKTVLELGRGEFRINGHLWRSYSPLISDDARLIAEFSPDDFTSREDIMNLIKGEDRQQTFFRIDMDGQEPAVKLFLLMDFVEASGASCWINPTEGKIESAVRIYAQPETEAEQGDAGKPDPATS